MSSALLRFSCGVACCLLALCLVYGCGSDDDGGGAHPGDVTPPAPVTNLAAIATTDSSVTLAWSAPGDDDMTGMATQYDLRYSTAPITEAEWGGAHPAQDVDYPATAATDETHTVMGLAVSTSYYFALKTADEAANWSELSNVATESTSGPESRALVVSAASLDFGREQEELTFTIANSWTETLNWTIEWTAANGLAWLTVNPTEGTTTTETDTIRVTVNRGTLDPGDYTGTMTVRPHVGDAQQVTVEMTIYVPLPPPMVYVRAGTFIMGDGLISEGEDEREVTLTRNFYLGQHEVTNQEYLEAIQWAYDQGYVSVTHSSVRDNLDGSIEVLLEVNNAYCEIQFDGAGHFYLRESTTSYAQNTYPAGYDPSDHPVQQVTWYGAVRYCDWMSLLSSLPRAYERIGNWNWSCNEGDPYGAAGYRLPTDAEWEYAAQYNDERLYPWGNHDPDCSRANYALDWSTTCVGWTSPVGSYPDAPAALGLSNLSGNVSEWCNDWWARNLGTSPATDPTGLISGDRRVTHGGIWSYTDSSCRCASRRGISPDAGFGFSSVGFRIAKTVSP